MKQRDARRDGPLRVHRGGRELPADQLTAPRHRRGQRPGPRRGRRTAARAQRELRRRPPWTGPRGRMQMFLWPGNQFGLPNARHGRWDACTRRATPATRRLRPRPASPPRSSSSTMPRGPRATAARRSRSRPASIARDGQHHRVQPHRPGDERPDRGRARGRRGPQHRDVSRPFSAARSTPPQTIPMVGISQAAGTAIKAALPTTGQGVPQHDPRADARRRRTGPRRSSTSTATACRYRLTGGPEHQLPERRRAGRRGLERLLRDQRPAQPGHRQPRGPARLRPVRAAADDRRQATTPRVTPDSARAVLAEHGAPARSPTTASRRGGWLNGTSLALPHGLGHGWAVDPLGPDLGPRREARLRPEPVRVVGDRRQPARAPVRRRSC